MKYLRFLVLLVLVSSCGSSKKVIDTPKTEPEIITDVKIDSVVMIKEDIAVKDVNIKNVVTDTVTITKNMKEERLVTNDSSGFHQELSKREGPLHLLFDELLQKHVSSSGNVDYKSFKSSHQKLFGYISVLQMVYLKLDSLSKEEKLAYWINAYNALTIDLILRNYPLNSIKDIDKPWDQRLWKFGNKWLNLNDIEHKILRKMDEPRMHFAIVCASFSCPKLQNTVFTAEQLETQLTEATKEFLADKTRNNISTNNLQLSKIFKWFAKDFKANGTLIDFLNTYSDIDIASNAKKNFKDYNWDLNE